MWVLILIAMIDGDVRHFEVGYFNREHACDVAGAAIAKEAGTSMHTTAMWECVHQPIEEGVLG